MWTNTGHFPVATDDGRRLEVYEDTDMVDTTTTEGRSVTPGRKKLRLADGTSLTPNHDGTFRVFPHGPNVRRVS